MTPNDRISNYKRFVTTDRPSAVTAVQPIVVA